MTFLLRFRICAAFLTGCCFFGAAVAGAAGDITLTEDVVYGRAGGQDLLIDVFRPASADAATSGARLLPAIIFVHGGGWVGGDRKAFHEDARWFAGQGFVCFSAGYRLVKPDSDKWPAQLDDVQLAIRWVRAHAKEYGVDPAAVGAVGGSAGGHLVALLATRDTRDRNAPLRQYSSRPECVVNFAGPSDLTKAFPTTATLGMNVQWLVDNFLGQPAAEAPEIAQDASPVTHVTADDSPILIIHGDKDTVVPPAQATILNDAMKRKGAPSRLVILKDEGHGLKPESRKIFRRESVEFFRKHLKPAE